MFSATCTYNAQTFETGFLVPKVPFVYGQIQYVVFLLFLQQPNEQNITKLEEKETKSIFSWLYSF